MLVIPTLQAVEEITVRGEVPRHPDVRDFKPWEWSGKPIRPNKVKAVFKRVDNGEWTLHELTVYGYDVLKSGQTSGNPNCYREHQISRTGEIHSYTRNFDREQIELTTWARDWAQIMLARINEVTERPDLEGEVTLGEPVDLDEPTPCGNQVGKFEGQDCRLPKGHTGDCPRVWPVDSLEPRKDGLRVRSTVNGVIFRYVEVWSRWVAEQDSGGDGNAYSWSALNGSNSAFSEAEMIEVLP